VHWSAIRKTGAEFKSRKGEDDGGEKSKGKDRNGLLSVSGQLATGGYQSHGARKGVMRTPLSRSGITITTGQNSKTSQRSPEECPVHEEAVREGTGKKRD